MRDTSKMDTPFRSRRAQRDEADKPVHITYIVFNTLHVVVEQSNKYFNVANQSLLEYDKRSLLSVSIFHFLCSSFYNCSQSMATQ